MTNHQTWQHIRLICSSGLPPLTVMPILSSALHKILPCLSFSYILTDHQARPLSYYAENFNDSTHKIFSQRGGILTSHCDDPASFNTLFQMPADYGNLLNPPAQFYQSSTYITLFAPNGLHNVIDMTIKHNNKPLALIGIFREKAAQKYYQKSGFNNKEIALLPLLYSHIKHLSLSKSSIETHTALLQSVHSKALGIGVDNESSNRLDIDSLSATITVNTSGDIVFASNEAIDLLKQGLSVKHRYLLDYKNNLQPMVKFLCQSLECKQACSSKLPPVYYLPVPNGILIIRAYRMNALTDSSGTPPYYSIHLQMQQPTRLKILYQLKKYQLSPKAMSVGWLIATGLNNTEICQQLGIQPSTLRSYLKNLYTLLDVNSHHQLKQKLTVS